MFDSSLSYILQFVIGHCKNVSQVYIHGTTEFRSFVVAGKEKLLRVSAPMLLLLRKACLRKATR